MESHQPGEYRGLISGLIFFKIRSTCFKVKATIIQVRYKSTPWRSVGQTLNRYYKKSATAAASWEEIDTENMKTCPLSSLRCFQQCFSYLCFTFCTHLVFATKSARNHEVWVPLISIICSIWRLQQKHFWSAVLKWKGVLGRWQCRGSSDILWTGFICCLRFLQNWV